MYSTKKNCTKNQITFDFNNNPATKRNNQKSARNEISFKLTGNIKLNSIINAKKDYNNNHFKKYFTNSLNLDFKKSKSNKKEIFERYN